MTKIRKEIRSLSPAELLALRRAMRRLQQRPPSDGSGFIGLGRLHGIPNF